NLTTVPRTPNAMAGSKPKPVKLKRGEAAWQGNRRCGILRSWAYPRTCPQRLCLVGPRVRPPLTSSGSPVLEKKQTRSPVDLKSGIRVVERTREAEALEGLVLLTRGYSQH